MSCISSVALLKPGGALSGFQEQNYGHLKGKNESGKHGFPYVFIFTFSTSLNTHGILYMNFLKWNLRAFMSTKQPWSGLH